MSVRRYEMNCEEAIELMDGYLDGELDAIANREIERHLRDCSKCAQAYESERHLIRQVNGGAPYYKAPAELRQSIQSSLRAEIARQPLANVSEKKHTRVFSRRSERQAMVFAPQWSWLALAAAIIAAAIVAVNFVPHLQRSRGEQFLATELIAGHVRSLMANHLTDVASSDQHTVKPWLDTKLDFAPPVFDLTNDGFPLIGGRLDYVENRPIAALVYQRRKHFINLFIWPAESVMTTADKTISRQGYQLAHWIDGDFNYWAVSDVSESDLQLFKQAFEKQLPPR
jgi:mycothiol system anti-sigma-R factor